MQMKMKMKYSQEQRDQPIVQQQRKEEGTVVVSMSPSSVSIVPPLSLSSSSSCLGGKYHYNNSNSTTSTKESFCFDRSQPTRRQQRQQHQKLLHQRRRLVGESMISRPSATTIPAARLLLLVVLVLTAAARTTTNAFVATQNHHHYPHHPRQLRRQPQPLPQQQTTKQTALNVWWFGGTEQDGATSGSGGGGADGDSCELVAVRIERTSPNSRKIAGDIVVPVPIDDVWQILTDYNMLSVHVPNLVESKIVRTLPPSLPPSASGAGRVGGSGGGRLASFVQGAAGSNVSGGRPGSAGVPGDGTFRCRLYQKGAQKIIGFDFSASVTMDMTEKIVVPPQPQRTVADTPASSSENQQQQQQQQQQRLKNQRAMPQERKINFKCVDSQFFTEFDGDWTVKEQFNSATGQIETLCSYVVDVRPKGPVPVAALEWRIREDVPSNLRAVKAAALLLSEQKSASTSAVEADSTDVASNIVTIDSARQAMGRAVRRAAANVPARNGGVQNRRLATVPILNDWEKDETMAKYL